MNSQLENIKTIIESLLEKLGVKGEAEAMETGEGVRFLIKSREGAILIGENGQNLLALSHIVKKIADRNFGETENKPIFSLDVNDYQAKKMEDLKNLARLNAQRVRYFKKEIAMRPMTSFERRIIHSVLTECPDITTESIGEEPNRKVVIKPYP
jgi:spoIIIJ-associated protein